MRIIDADALPIDSIDMSNMIEITDRGIAVVRLEDIVDAPTIDAVSVVRCKECRFWQKSRERAVMCCLREVPNRPMNADDYCSYGEREGE